MKIAICGATGFIGSHLSAHLRSYGYEVIPLGREYFDENQRVEKLVNLVASCRAVINLAGAPIRHRWNREYRQVIYGSRVGTVRRLTEAIGKMAEPPEVFISVSAVGYYPDSGCYDEYNGVKGEGFLADVCEAWELAARQVPECVRVVTPRFGVVLSYDGGAFPSMILPFRKGVAMQIGSGKQAFSWIALEDLLRAMDFILVNAEMSGPVNFVAPERLNNREFTRQMKVYYRNRILLSVPRWFFRLLYGEAAQVVISGQCAVPRKLMEAGYTFRCATLRDFMLRNQ